MYFNKYISLVFFRVFGKVFIPEQLQQWKYDWNVSKMSPVSHTVYNILSRRFTATSSFSCVTIGFSYGRSVSSVTKIIINVRRNQALNPPVSAAILAYAFFSMIATWGLKDKSRSNVTPRILRVGSISMDLSPIKRLYGYWDFPSVIAWVLVAFTCR